MTPYKKPQKKGIARLPAAYSYSQDGLLYAFSHEAAFRQELCLVAFLTAVLFFLPISALWKCLLFFTTSSVLIVELLNSAIESVVDLVSPDYHRRAKQAKDLGSAAVFLCIVFNSVLWGYTLLVVFNIL